MSVELHISPHADAMEPRCTMASGPSSKPHRERPGDVKDPATFAVIEPRIWHIARELERLLSLVELEYEGKPVRVDGFRLRDLAPWQDATASNALNAVIPISGRCNSRCQFCFEQDLPYPRELSLMSLEEARTRLSYYCAETGACLFPSNRPHMEAFVNPQALDILELARRRDPETLFCLTTNGSHLDEDTVAHLSTLKPLLLKLSINVVDPELRNDLTPMGRRSEIAVRAPRLLHQYRVPFIGSIVAWPSLPLEAIEETVDYLALYEAYVIRIRLPVVHRWMREQPTVDWRAHWQSVAAFAHRLRERCRAPLLVDPPLYWVTPIVPQVDGVILNSPADQAGLHWGDVIQSVNGQTVLTRTHAEGLLRRCREGHQAAIVSVKRGDEELCFLLEPSSSGTDRYPYEPRQAYPGENYGVLLVEDFRLGYIQKVIEVIERYEVHDVLLFSSPIIAPIFQMLARGLPDYAERLASVNLTVESVYENALGGNFNLLDSRFVEDYACAIRQRLQEGLKVDLILIPCAFGSGWGMDLRGASYAQLASEFGIPVELIDWCLIYGRDV